MLVPSAKSQGVVFRRVVNKKSDKNLRSLDGLQLVQCDGLQLVQCDGLQFVQGDGLQFVQGDGLHFHPSITGLSFLGSPWLR